MELQLCRAKGCVELHLLSRREGGHFQRDPLPQILCLLATLQVLENIIKLHHAHGSQAEGASGAADGIHKVIVVSWSEMDQPVMDVLQVDLLAPLHQLVEGWGAQVVVHMRGIEPLQSFHDDILKHKRVQHSLGCTNTKLMHVVYT